MYQLLQMKAIQFVGHLEDSIEHTSKRCMTVETCVVRMSLREPIKHTILFSIHSIKLYVVFHFFINVTVPVFRKLFTGLLLRKESGIE